MTRLIKAAVRSMIRAKSGRIVGIGSITAHQGAQGNATYAATKGAMASYMKTLSVEIARKGVTANVVAPGYVDTEMLAPYRANREAVEKQIPAGRFAGADEIASLVCYLLAPEAAYITGAEIPIDGGLTAAIGIKN
jgi:NAD(P)-dependent dehydrogenase (short-subunit alcohol dehydrogenase family)